MVRVRRAAKKGGGAKKERGCEKKGGAPHPPFFKKGGARSTGTPPVYAPAYSTSISHNFYLPVTKWLKRHISLSHLFSKELDFLHSTFFAENLPNGPVNLLGDPF